MEDKNRLHILIDAYFNGELTTAEERALRKYLLSMPEPDSRAEEALAVMAYSGVSTPESQASEMKILPANTVKSLWLRYSIAAAVILLMIGGIGLAGQFSQNHVNGECLAYVNGVEVKGKSHIQALIATQLEEMGEASRGVDDEMNSDFEDIREALKFE